MADKQVSISIKLKDEFTKSMRTISESFEKHANTMKSVGRSMSTYITLPATALAGFSVQSASQMSNISDGYDRLTKRFGINSEDLVKSLEKASGGAVSQKDIMLQANKAMSLGVADNTEKMVALMEVARLKSRDMGITTAEAFDNIVTGIGRGSPLILDNLGIIVKVGEANENYAKSIGKTADSLTEAEQQQALMNAVMVSAEQDLKNAGELNVTYAEKLQQTSAQFINMKVALGDILLPIITAVMAKITALMQWFTGLSDNTQKVILAFGAVIAISGPLITAITAIGTALLFLSANPIVLVIAAITLLIAAIVALGVIMYQKRDEFSEAFSIMADNVIYSLLWLKDKAIELWNALLSGLETIITSITDFFVTGFENIKIFIFGIMQSIYDFFGSILSGISTAWTTTWNNVFNFVKITILGVKEVITSGISGVVNFIGGAKDLITGAFVTAWSGITGVTENIINSIKGAFKGMVNFVIDIINKLINASNSVTGTLNKLPGVNIGKISYIPALAKGGIVNKPTLAMIGEDGPEAVVPLSKKNNPMYGQGGGVTINITGTFLSEDVAEQLGNAIVSKLALSTRF